MPTCDSVILEDFEDGYRKATKYYPNRGSLRLAETVDEIAHVRPALPRQFVSFTFYRARPDWKTLPDRERDLGRQEFINAINIIRATAGTHIFTRGTASNVDFMVWAHRVPVGSSAGRSGKN